MYYPDRLSKSIRLASDLITPEAGIIASESDKEPVHDVSGRGRTWDPIKNQSRNATRHRCTEHYDKLSSPSSSMHRRFYVRVTFPTFYQEIVFSRTTECSYHPVIMKYCVIREECSILNIQWCAKISGQIDSSLYIPRATNIPRLKQFQLMLGIKT